jgi:hypothetical protein
MKMYQLHSSTAAILTRFPAFRKGLEGEKLLAAHRQRELRQVFLGGDLEQLDV